MKIHLLDDSLLIEIIYKKSDQNNGDNICMRVTENCPGEEKLFKAHETNLNLTPQQAGKIASPWQKQRKKACRIDVSSCNSGHLINYQ